MGPWARHAASIAQGQLLTKPTTVQASVFYTIANFDSCLACFGPAGSSTCHAVPSGVVCAAVTTTRKLLSVLISVLEGFAEVVRAVALQRPQVAACP